MQPITDHDWQLAVDAAHALSSIEAAREYGLIIGGPTIDLVRCAEILQEGATRGITPAHTSPGRYVAEWNGEVLRVLGGDVK
jgi:hypothetical protein